MVNFIGHLVDDKLSYQISRSHSHGRGFKIGVIVISILVFASLTVVNLATNGFDNQVIYTPDPNSTAAERQWFNHKFFTWGDDALKPKCENVEIPIGHEFLTTNFGLRYKIQKIQAKDGKPRASVSYHNNSLTDCEISNVGISLMKSDFAKPTRDYRWAPWIPSLADATARCNITTEDGPYRLEFRTEYKTYVESYDFIAIDDPWGHATIWWGARLMNAFFVGTQYVMSGPLPDTDDDTPVYTRARLSFETHEESKNMSMKDPAMFNMWFYFLHPTTGIRETMEDDGMTTAMLYNNASFSKSRPMTEGLFFAKTFSSLVLADLGNNKTSNLLLDADLLQYALDPKEDNFNRIEGAPLAHNKTNPDWWKFDSITPPAEWPSADTGVQFNEAYDQLKDKTGALGTNAATINSVYTCSKPVKKSTTTMLLVTLVANLALFQTLWGLFKYVLDQQMTWKDEQANYCEGCIKDVGIVEPRDAQYSPITMQEKHRNLGSSSTQTLLGGDDGHR